MTRDDDMRQSEALGVARAVGGHEGQALIVIAHGEAQASRLAGAARAFAGPERVIHLPAWDCLPFDRTSPSRGVMGRRVEAIRRLLDGGHLDNGAAPPIVIAGVEAVAQRLSREAAGRVLRLAPGDPAPTADALAALFYEAAEEAEVPGEFAPHPALIDVFPAAGERAVRIRLAADGRIGSIERIERRTHRAGAPLEAITIGSASELVDAVPAAGKDAGDDQDADTGRQAGAVHRLAAGDASLATLFELLPGAVLLLDADADERMRAHLATVGEARDAERARARAGRGAMPVDGLYLTEAEWDAIAGGPTARVLDWPRARALPAFGVDRADAATALVEQRAEAGARVGLSGARLARALGLDADTREVPDWPALLALPDGVVGILPDGLAAGFDAAEALVLADADVLAAAAQATDVAALFSLPLLPGDAAIHLDHGMARLEGIVTVEADGHAVDCLALGFAGDGRTLVPCAEMDRVWRYGAASEAVSLDRADGTSWAKRCGALIQEIEATAAHLVGEVEARRGRSAPRLVPPARAMARFVAGFPFTPTADQDAAFAAIAADLGSGRPMDRLLCGEAGFGKTEVALRAAAIAALSGHQVAVLAPTTVLVRQHLATFRRRYAPLGLAVEGLSRLTRPADARRIRSGLADGTVAIVVGTQSLAGEDTRFSRLGLVVIDEEQRFGTDDKAALTRLREAVHALSMTATPIPRTLERALAGLASISVLATPPARRLPVRTEVAVFDEAVLATALIREHARGGQSFCVVPRIRDLDDVQATIARVAPALSVVVLHGRMKPDALDAALVGFADGHGDVLLATDIIEAGLDIPRANTMLVWHADRFGLAQLHQIRGRVGRGRVRGCAFLFTRPEHPPSATAAARLASLAAHDGLGAGFDIAARDLDLRGGGDLAGDEQAGHARLLGVPLARHLTDRALRAARGEAVAPDWRPEMSLSLPATIPADYIPDEAARLALHARLARPHGVQALADELGDRFGPLPDAMRHLLAQGEFRQACRALGIARLEVGPAGAAVDFRPDTAVPEIDGFERKDRRLLLRRATRDPDERIAAARHLLQAVRRQARTRETAPEPRRSVKRTRAAAPAAAPASAVADQPPAANSTVARAEPTAPPANRQAM